MHTDTGRTAITGEPDPMPQLAHLEIVVHPPLVNVRIMRDAKGDYTGIAQIQTQRGPLTFTAHGSEALLRVVLERVAALKLRAAGSPVASAGAFADWAKEMAQKITKAQVVNKLVEQAKAVGKNPAIARAVGLSTVVVPGTGQAVIALQSASELLEGLRKKNPAAITAYRRMHAQAKLGNLKARRSVHVLHAVARAPRIVSRH